MTNEEFYDETIAPAIIDLAKQCQDRGMSFVASVERAKGTAAMTPRPVRLQLSRRKGFDLQKRLACLGKTANGSPRHPLYVKGDKPLEPFP